jgi:hypothetical protein
VKGDWSDPPAELVRKEPVEDVAEGIFDFFRDAARSGGQLTDSVLQKSGGVFDGSRKQD